MNTHGASVRRTASKMSSGLWILSFGMAMPPFAGTSAYGQCGCPADLTVDARRDGTDIPLFLDCLLDGTVGKPGCACANMNVDTQVDVLDVEPFVNALLNGGPCAFPVAGLEPGSLETPLASPGASAKNCGMRFDNDAGTGIYLFSGESHYEAVDMRIKGRGLDFVWGRKYRSRFGPNTAMGNGWDFSYNIYIETSGPDRILHDGNSRTDTYSLQPNGKWGRNEFFRELEQEIDGTFTLVFADNGKWRFRSLTNPIAPGRISSVDDRNGNSLSFQYDGSGRLVVITDALGRTIDVAYNVDGFISSVTDFTGRQVIYSYYQNGDVGGSTGDLKSVRSPIVSGTPNGNDFPAGKTTTFTYSKAFADSALNHNLLTVSDPKGQTYLTYDYSGTTDPNDLNFDRAKREIWGNPEDIIDWTITGFSTVGPYRMIITANDRVGNVREYSYDEGNRLVRKREFTGRAPDADAPTTGLANRPTGKLRVTDPDLFETAWEYNEDSLITRTDYPNGNETQNVYELALNPNAARRERGNLRQRIRLPGPLGGDQASITESFTYETGLGGCGCGGTNFVKSYTDGRGNTETHTYDAAGNRTHTTHRIPNIVDDWEFNAFGQITAHILPDNGSGHRRRDEYTYYAAGPQTGYLQSMIVDAPNFALITTYEYDSRGNLVRIIDPRGNDTLHARNQLDQIVREHSRSVVTTGGPVRYEKLYFRDANDNLVRTDVQNVDDAGGVGSNTHFTTITDVEILNKPIRTIREKGSFAVPLSQLTTIGMPDTQFTAEEYGYDAGRNLIIVILGMAANGTQPANTVSTQYDERDKPFRTIQAATDPGHSTTQFDYDKNGNAWREFHGTEDAAAPHITEYTHDGYDRRVTTTDAMGNVRTMHYDANNNMVSDRLDGELNDEVGSASNVRVSESTYTYDVMDRRTISSTAHFNSGTQAAIGDGQSTTVIVYNGHAGVLSVTNDNNHATTTAYDTANRVSLQTDAKGNTITYAYDQNSNVISMFETDKSDLGNPDQVFTTTYGYDGEDRRVSVTDNIGSISRDFYDSRDLIVRNSDAMSKETAWVYDGLSRLLRTVRDMNGDGASLTALPGDGNPDIVTAQTWDDSGRLTSRTDDNGNATTYAYDALDRRIATTYADCTTDSRMYDVHGNAAWTTDQNGTVVTCQYDRLDRAVQKMIAPGPGVDGATTFEAYQFDGRSRMNRAENDDSIVSRGHDSLSKTIRDTINGVSTTFGHDGVGNRLITTAPGGRVIQIAYDGLELLRVISEPGFGLIADYSYIGRGRVERRNYGNGTRTTWAYDGVTGVPNPPGDFGVKQVINTRHFLVSNNSNIDVRTYTWDNVGNKTASRDTRLAGPQYRHLYSYDSAYSLIRTQVLNPADTVLRDENYYLDGVRNRIKAYGGDNPGIYSMDGDMCELPADQDMNQYTITPFDSRQYDQNGNLIAVDATLPSQRLFKYDFRNRLVEYVSAAGTVSRYKYDCLGRRIEKIVDVSGTPTTTRFFYDSWRVIEERDGAGATTATYSVVPRPRSLRGWPPFRFASNIAKGSESAGAIDLDDLTTLLSMRLGGVNYYYHEDEAGSIRALTNSTGGVAERYEYGDFGQCLNPTTLAPIGNPSPSGNPLGFTGLRYDVETGFDVASHRYLDPRAGRWISPDPLGTWADPVSRGNAQCYVGNNPASHVDPHGTWAVPAAVVGAAAATFTIGCSFGVTACIIDVAAMAEDCKKQSCPPGQVVDSSACDKTQWKDAVNCAITCGANGPEWDEYKRRGCVDFVDKDDVLQPAVTTLQKDESGLMKFQASLATFSPEGDDGEVILGCECSYNPDGECTGCSPGCSCP